MRKDKIFLWLGLLTAFLFCTTLVMAVDSSDEKDATDDKGEEHPWAGIIDDDLKDSEFAHWFSEYEYEDFDGDGNYEWEIKHIMFDWFGPAESYPYDLKGKDDEKPEDEEKDEEPKPLDEGEKERERKGDDRPDDKEKPEWKEKKGKLQVHVHNEKIWIAEDSNSNGI